MMNRIFEQRVYMDDVDAMGCVYHANYLKFCERARTEMLRAAGFCHGQLILEGKNFFVMRRIEMHYLAPAYLKDILRIETAVIDVKGASVTFEQRIFRESVLIGQLIAQLVYVNHAFKVSKIPISLRNMFQQLMSKQTAA
jgi:acyl-CoA thioester hydrolase